MELSDKYGNWRIYKSSYNSLNKFTNNKLDLLFSEIDVLWLNKYEQWQRKNGNKDIMIGMKVKSSIRGQREERTQLLERNGAKMKIIYCKHMANK